MNREISAFVERYVKETPVYNFFKKINIVQGTLVYNRFANKFTQKESDPVRHLYYTTITA